MRDRPSGAELAALAEALGEEGPLAARCRAVQAREHDAGDAFAACRAALVARYGAGEDRFLLERLAADIRGGALDDGSADREALSALLRAITRQKLRESNPDYLG
ncbi:MAG TPA: DUF6285 domain-containing protein [Stellaceae bacterium]|jgi:hypothetical protein